MSLETVTQYVRPVYDFVNAASPILVAWLAWDRIKAFGNRLNPFHL